jgi:hypothetical protein
MLVVFNATTNIDLIKAKSLAMSKFPKIKTDISAIQTHEGLEEILLENGLVLFVEVNPDDSVKSAERRAETIERENNAEINEPICKIPDEPLFTDDELAELNANVCSILDDTPDESMSFDNISDTEITNIEDFINAAQLEADAKVNEVMSCVSDMQSCADRINILLEKEQRAHGLYVSLEDLWYNMRIMSQYYERKLEVLDERVGTFDALIIKKRTVTGEMDNHLRNRNRLSEWLADGAGGQIKNTEWLRHHKLYTNKVAELRIVDRDINTAKTGAGVSKNILLKTFSSELHFETELKALLSGSGVGTMSSVVGKFSTKTNVNVKTFMANPRMEIDMKFNLEDPDNILAGLPKTFTSGTSDIKISSYNKEDSFNGILYDMYYNIYTDLDKFFTPQERGLSNNKLAVDSSLKNTGAERVNDSYISSFSVFKEFHENFKDKWVQKCEHVKQNVVEPGLQSVTKSLRNFAEKEVVMYLAYGKVYDNLVHESTNLSGSVDTIRRGAVEFFSMFDNVLRAKNKAEATLIDIREKIESEKVTFTNVPCALRTTEDEVPTNEPGTDPLGVTSLTTMDPENPNPTKMCYWVKFAKMATTINLIPKYWPIGIIIPTPAKLVKIPLPIIWIPLALVVTHVGMFVIFIGQCGLCPSPFVLYIGPNWEKKFIVSLRPTGEFGSTASSGILKVFGKDIIPVPGINIPKKIIDVLNDFKSPSGLPVLKIKDQDSQESVMSNIKDKVLKKVNKLGLPDMRLLDDIKTNRLATPQQKIDAIRDTIITFVEKIDMPDFSLPEDQSKINPKLPGTITILDKMVFAGKMEMPDMINSNNKAEINILDKFQEKLDEMKNKLASSQDIEDPSLSLPIPGDEESERRYLSSIKKNLLVMAKLVSDQAITKNALGLSVIATSSISFVNPYKCKPGTSGLIPPTIPVLVNTITAMLKVAIVEILSDLSMSKIKDILKTSVVTKRDLVKILEQSIGTLPRASFSAPNPSNINMKDMMKDSILKMAKLPLPVIPSGLPQLAIKVSGNSLKGPLISAIRVSLSDQSIVVQLFDIDKFNGLSAVDVKVMAINILEQSINALDNIITPAVIAAKSFKKAEVKLFPETLGLKPTLPSDGVLMVDKKLHKVAQDYLKVMSLVPWPAVAVAQAAFKNLHPILKSDDLPPWERLSLDNFLFVCFLTQFVSAGKKGGGFFENP